MSSLAAQFAKKQGLPPGINTSFPKKDSPNPPTELLDMSSQTQEVEMSAESESEEDLEISAATAEIIDDKVDKFISEFGPQIMELTIKKWLVQQEKAAKKLKNSKKPSLTPPPNAKKRKAL